MSLKKFTYANQKFFANQFKIIQNGSILPAFSFKANHLFLGKVKVIYNFIYYILYIIYYNILLQYIFN